MTHIWDQKIQKQMRYRLVQKKYTYRIALKNKIFIKLSKYIMFQDVSWKFEMKKCKNDWVMSSWSLTAMEVTSTVSELGLSQILREKIIVSNTQIFHQIIKIWHEIRHLVKIWDPKIQKWLRYRLLNKNQKKQHLLYRTQKPNFSSNYQNISWTKMFHENLRWKNAKTTELYPVDLWLPWR